VIFTGTAVRMNDPDAGQGRSLEWSFVVDGIEKGNVDERITVTAPRAHMCGYPFELGERYRVFASDRTTWWEPKAAMLSGTERVPSLPNPPAVEGTFADPTDWPLISLAALIGLIGLALFVRVTRSPRSRPAQT
jgi:hypothetical protein